VSVNVPVPCMRRAAVSRVSVRGSGQQSQCPVAGAHDWRESTETQRDARLQRAFRSVTRTAWRHVRALKNREADRWSRGCARDDTKSSVWCARPRLRLISDRFWRDA